jgi:DNA-binding MarR family transcriptional regulator
MPRCYVGDRPNYDWGVTAAQVSRDRVTPEQLEVWRSFLRAHSLIIRRLETDLMDRHGIPLAWYDVLARLVESDDRRLRMSDLAERVMLSPSGLTRLVDRMVEAGLLCREPSENDARGSYAVLTDHGFETLRSATGTHLRGIRDYVLGRFTDAELLQISRYLARLVS